MNERTEAAHVDLLAAIVQALDLPLPSITEADERRYYRLLERRALAVRIIIESNRAVTRDPQRAANAIRTRTAEEPITYTPFEPEKNGDER
ncbi:hypothetical protein KPP03845_106029 [Streptomyces xanthophaeus]|uniref:hypothetical protein n=1 Tax=Streptomyces xanthophaeus TaxID=67385 RepID=UPI00233E58B0|nr:hypothetical protein [Streptomyces xanthophaeus]WCD89608.1 hypothetical protein KPP03845_106029 [Streptomyces xanthophaeus]